MARSLGGTLDNRENLPGKIEVKGELLLFLSFLSLPPNKQQQQQNNNNKKQSPDGGARGFEVEQGDLRDFPRSSVVGGGGGGGEGAEESEWTFQPAEELFDRHGVKSLKAQRLQSHQARRREARGARASCGAAEVSLQHFCFCLVTV